MFLLGTLSWGKILLSVLSFLLFYFALFLFFYVADLISKDLKIRKKENKIEYINRKIFYKAIKEKPFSKYEMGQTLYFVSELGADDFYKNSYDKYGVLKLACEEECDEEYFYCRYIPKNEMRLENRTWYLLAIAKDGHYSYFLGNAYDFNFVYKDILFQFNIDNEFLYAMRPFHLDRIAYKCFTPLSVLLFVYVYNGILFLFVSDNAGEPYVLCLEVDKGDLSKIEVEIISSKDSPSIVENLISSIFLENLLIVDPLKNIPSVICYFEKFATEIFRNDYFWEIKDDFNSGEKKRIKHYISNYRIQLLLSTIKNKDKKYLS